jgi:hypothetical protein
MISQPLTRRYSPFEERAFFKRPMAPPSPRKRGEAGNRSAKSQIMATLLSPLGRGIGRSTRTPVLQTGYGEGWVTQ